MCVNIPHAQIRSFYQLIAAADPNAFNMLLTVFDGKNAGEKCLLSSGNLMGELRRSGFFARHLQEIRDMTHGGVLELDGNRVLCELLGNEKKMVICGGTSGLASASVNVTAAPMRIYRSSAVMLRNSGIFFRKRYFTPGRFEIGSPGVRNRICFCENRQGLFQRGGGVTIHHNPFPSFAAPLTAFTMAL